MKAKQLQDIITQVQDQLNSEGLSDLLGLTPDQMHVLLYGQFDEIEPILHFNDKFEQSLLETVPVVAKVRLLIQMIGELGEAKATENGYLPKKIVNALCDCHGLASYTVQSEEYALEVLALRHAVTKCGWLKKKNRKFVLTRKGQLIFEKGFTVSDYIILLKHWLKNYNWSFADGYPECGIVQHAAIFSLYILHKKAKELFSTEHFAKIFIKAFPAALEGLAVHRHLPVSAEEELADIVRIRFLERFAKYFGLVEHIIDPSLPYLERGKKSQVKTTRLFTEALHWFENKESKFTLAFDKLDEDLLH